MNYSALILLAFASMTLATPARPLDNRPERCEKDYTWSRDYKCCRRNAYRGQVCDDPFNRCPGLCESQFYCFKYHPNKAGECRDKN